VKARLLVRVRSGETRAFELQEAESILGREASLAVTLPVEGIAPRHARVAWDGRQHWLEDLQAPQGTFLNGRRIGKEKERLQHLSVITLGRATDLVYVVRSEATLPLQRTGILRAFLIRNLPDALPYEIPLGEVTVGRSSACNVVSESPEVSKTHARLTRTAERLMLRDLGSSNGTYVAGVRVAEAPLQDGDLVSFAGEEYRVSIALGEVSSSSTGLRVEDVKAAVDKAVAEKASPRFSTDWKQRVEGDREGTDRRRRPKG
jgi:pSer/pThr/pTyr-binding forkhead associated (FHA) protein